MRFKDDCTGLLALVNVDHHMCTLVYHSYRLQWVGCHMWPLPQSSWRHTCTHQHPLSPQSLSQSSMCPHISQSGKVQGHPELHCLSSIPLIINKWKLKSYNHTKLEILHYIFIPKHEISKSTINLKSLTNWFWSTKDLDNELCKVTFPSNDLFWNFDEFWNGWFVFFWFCKKIIKHNKIYKQIMFILTIILIFHVFHTMIILTESIKTLIRKSNFSY